MHLVARHHYPSAPQSSTPQSFHDSSDPPAPPRGSKSDVARGRRESSWVRPLADPADASYGVVPSLTIGRSEADWNVPWDEQVSRRHVRIESLGGGRIRVQKLAGATNPVFYAGNARENFTLGIGESFVIGQTRFECIEAPTMQADPEMLRTMASENWVDDETTLSENAPESRGNDRQGGSSEAESKAKGEVELLSRQLESLHRLPNLLKTSSSLDEAISRVIEMVRPLISGLDQIAVASVPIVDEKDSPQQDAPQQDAPQQDAPQQDSREQDSAGEHRRGGGGGGGDPEIVSGDGLSGSVGASDSVQTLAPELLRRVARDGQSVLRRASGDGGRPRWIAGVPIGTFGNRQWVWWIAGRGKDAAGPRRAMQFLSVVSQMAHQWYRDRAATRRQNTMARFFSPTVLSSMVKHERQFQGDVDDPETLRDLLRPRSAELTVLFFDLRGFTDWTNSRAAAGDLSGLMEHLHESMSIVTNRILASGGVVGDFHGDAVMGFWGWPMQPDTPHQTCDLAVSAAMAINRAILDASIDAEIGDPLRGGIGIATGVAFAGAIGSDDQLKVTAIGPVVNLAARLQAETRRLSESVVIDSVTHSRLSSPNKDGVDITPLDPMEIRGWKEPVAAFGVKPSGVA